MNVRAIALLCALLGSALTTAASAHVTVTPKTVARGSTAVLTFRCPNERSNATTTSLVVQLPPDADLRTIKAEPLPGWHATIALRNGRADTVRWSGGSIAPGAAQTFSIVAGPMPRAARQLPFKAVQTYSNGEVVRWIDLRGPGEAEPPQPAPVVNVR